MKRLLFIIVLATMTSMSAKAGEPTITVEIWTGADDGLTQRLADALRQIVAKDLQFRLAPAYTKGAFKILIPDHVAWNRDSSDVTVKAEFSIDGNALGQTTVACTQNTLGECATRIFLAAKRALPKR